MPEQVLPKFKIGDIVQLKGNVIEDDLDAYNINIYDYDYHEHYFVVVGYHWVNEANVEVDVDADSVSLLGYYTYYLLPFSFKDMSYDSDFTDDIPSCWYYYEFWLEHIPEEILHSERIQTLMSNIVAIKKYFHIKDSYFVHNLGLIEIVSISSNKKDTVCSFRRYELGKNNTEFSQNSFKYPEIDSCIVGHYLSDVSVKKLFYNAKEYITKWLCHIAPIR